MKYNLSLIGGWREKRANGTLGTESLAHLFQTFCSLLQIQVQ